MYLLQIALKGLDPNHTAMLCPRCHEVTDSSTDLHCHCGGHRELLAHWNWVPDNETHIQDQRETRAPERGR